MDFFTHLMIGFLISSGLVGSFSNQYVVLGTLMAALPDFDIFLYPLWKRIPITRHHGITHTAIFVIAASVTLFAVFGAFTGIADPKLLIVMLLGGFSHIFCDFITNWGVPLFYPFEKGYSKINLDMSVNPYTILFFFPGVIFLDAARLNYFASFDLKSATIVIGLIYLVYFVSRVGFKIYYTKKPENEGFSALPTLIPYKWKFAKRIETDGEIRVLIKSNPRTRTYVIPKARLERINKCQDLVNTFWLGQVQDYMRVFEYPYYETDCLDGRMKITWRSAEMGELLSVHVVCVGDNLKSWVEFKRGKKTFSRQQ
ncbi:MAG: metal-dependent hydrolase [Methanotrichaceae archaeon]